MSATSTAAAVSAYAVELGALSGVAWADSSSTWIGRLWIILLVAAAICATCQVVEHRRHREVAAFKLGLEMARLTQLAEQDHDTAPPRRLRAVGDAPGES